jgi:hypothetical protein
MFLDIFFFSNGAMLYLECNLPSMANECIHRSAPALSCNKVGVHVEVIVIQHSAKRPVILVLCIENE